MLNEDNAWQPLSFEQRLAIDGALSMIGEANAQLSRAADSLSELPQLKEQMEALAIVHVICRNTLLDIPDAVAGLSDD